MGTILCCGGLGELEVNFRSRSGILVNAVKTKAYYIDRVGTVLNKMKSDGYFNLPINCIYILNNQDVIIHS